MKTNLWTLIMSILLLCTSSHTLAQQEAAAKKILNQVSQKYDGYKTIQATFSFSAKQADGSSYADNGTLSLDKNGNKYLIEMRAQQLISDGKTTWTILKEEGEVQINDADNSNDNINPSNIFSFYKSGFKYVSAPDETVGQTTLSVVDLSPIDTKKNYFKIKLRINKSTKQIYDATIFDKSGSRYTYTIKSLKGNVSFPAGTFAYNKSKYPGLEVVDLR
ncbi:LolA family protein [Sphingobacterium sp. SYP-B4668]|uniref:LolA family protein n=1 Tax=Sphingobacterium sp. SYP-B4668 TaxID=2996035 RepID=UPI0005324003|nr:outer membrane lipoprotein carrier protein LolA [Sphingobacterium sp. SYP-B4668]